MKLARSAVCKAIYFDITLIFEIDYSRVQSLPEIWTIAQQQFSHIIALKDPHAQPEVSLTYAQMYRHQQFASGLQALGVIKRRSVALFAESNARWAISVLVNSGIKANCPLKRKLPRNKDVSSLVSYRSTKLVELFGVLQP